MIVQQVRTRMHMCPDVHAHVSMSKSICPQYVGRSLWGTARDKQSQPFALDMPRAPLTTPAPHPLTAPAQQSTEDSITITHTSRGCSSEGDKIAAARCAQQSNLIVRPAKVTILGWWFHQPRACSGKRQQRTAWEMDNLLFFRVAGAVGRGWREQVSNPHHFDRGEIGRGRAMAWMWRGQGKASTFVSHDFIARGLAFAGIACAKWASSRRKVQKGK